MRVFLFHCSILFACLVLVATSAHSGGTLHIAVDRRIQWMQQLLRAALLRNLYWDSRDTKATILDSADYKMLFLLKQQGAESLLISLVVYK